MPLFYSDPKNRPVSQVERAGTHLATRFPWTWQRDPGVVGVRSEDWGHPGASWRPPATHFSEGPYKGFRKSYLGTSLREARKTTRSPVGEGATTPRPTVVTGTGLGQSRYAPKRLWNYQLSNIAPAHTTLGRMRTMFRGFVSPVFRR